MNPDTPIHPLGSRAKILLTSVFGPFAQDDEYGSRAINPMELYHNQVTREQGPFSLRMFHRSFGLILMKENLDAPCTLLDFPDLERFESELSHNSYDIVGISSIMPNIGKVEKMCEMIRERLPHAVIVVGGHIANVPGLKERIGADHVCKGDGVRWFRQYLGLDPNAPVRHPHVLSGFGTRILGVGVEDSSRDTAAMLIPSVGCPVGCNFCSTSALFGGKGKFVNFFETGDELYAVMRELKDRHGVQSFFVMDENFLLHRARALRLLELMEENHESWSLYVFSSARVLKSYSMEQLVRLGVSWVWMGIEGDASTYRKLNGVDTRDLVNELQSHGIRVLGSTIIGLENHTPENMDEVIDHAVIHDTVFHQFMLYTPLPGTPFYEHHRENGTLLGEDECPAADSHGQCRFNYVHEHIRGGQETGFLREAFRRDFAVNGPSLARMVRVMISGWKRYHDHPDACVRARMLREMGELKTTYAGALWAMTRWYRGDRAMHAKLKEILRELYALFGLKARIAAPLMGLYAYFALAREEGRLRRGWTYEPPTFCEKNARALEQEMPVPAHAEPAPLRQPALRPQAVSRQS